MRKDLEKKKLHCQSFPENHLSVVVSQVNSDSLQKMCEPTSKVD